ncbi:isopentenyl transferase family protein [Chondromyces crocatus]|uniref:Isopentenyl-diphosphate delta isomerase n=1 Tax=Chondromyces crocatus TaxID=52 RepID=A0A0K1E996_CHOCO|nr:isopentenyl transferase family protein [Chondromyces crocatus]AKT37445.1 isopentenyl-diphosphate delta isomerase [Chondromyces crocatus]
MKAHCIVGATGTGKTARATSLARQTGAPVLVLDRFQVFEDLASGTGRPLSREVAGTTRLYLGHRYMMDGELTRQDALLDFLRTVGKLAVDHDFIILEGGSISLNEALIEESLLGTTGVTVERMRMTSVKAYEQGLRRRARMMLTPSAERPSMIEELARGWDNPRLRAFLSSITGYDAIVDHCEQAGIEPAELAAGPVDPVLIDEVVLSHMKYAAKQTAAFNQLFPEQSSFPGCQPCTA